GSVCTSGNAATRARRAGPRPRTVSSIRSGRGSASSPCSSRSSRGSQAHRVVRKDVGARQSCQGLTRVQQHGAQQFLTLTPPPPWRRTPPAASRGTPMNGTRRDVILLLGSVLAAWPLRVAAQQTPRVFRVGVLSPGTAPPGPLEALRQGLRDLGYEDGRNISIEWRFAGASNEPLRDLAEELVRLKVDVIVAINTQASLAAKRATATTPIVIARVSDPVKTGLVASFAHPGGNVTGLSNFSDELSGKRLAVIKEVMPTVARLAVLWNTGNP